LRPLPALSLRNPLNVPWKGDPHEEARPAAWPSTAKRSAICRQERSPQTVVVTVQDTQQPACYSPLCVPTYWKTCETNTALA